MATKRIAVIAGDGIGPEVVEQAVRVAENAAFATGEALLQWERFPWGTGYFFDHKEMMPPDAIVRLREFDAILFGAVGDPKVPDHVTLNGLLLPIRREFDQYVNLRPSFLYPGIRSPLADKQPGSIDLVVVRENTEGEYADVGGRLYRHTFHEVALQTAVFTRRGVERVIRAAFDLAVKRRGHVTSITKSNAQGFSLVLWDEVFTDVAADYPAVRTHALLVDAAAMELIRRPERFDVIVASNLFGDILSEITATITGGIGLAASANLNPEKTSPSMFEPVHGSAPDIAGQGIANPIGAVLAAAMMLEHLGMTTAARLIDDAVRRVLRAGQIVTPDLGGEATTTDVGDAVLHQMRRK
jgi:tartrate dehydrogenase/decarboxylase/D-malate dehydrogenase